ncbi:MAG: hypothetical protein ACI87N_000539, partial [Flavobacteriales bacterium]
FSSRQIANCMMLFQAVVGKLNLGFVLIFV